MLIEECIRAFGSPIFTQREMNQPHPRLRDRLVITTIERFRHLVGGIESLNRRSHPLDGLIQRISSKVKIGNLDMFSMVSVFRRPFRGFKSFEK